jgi:anti-sigma B factor antagonist
VKVADGGNSVVIRVEGELDLYRCPELLDALRGAESSQADRIILDLQALRFIDAAGLQVLLAASRRSASNGDRLRVTRGRGEVARMFGLMALDRTLPFASPDEISEWPRLRLAEGAADRG